MLWATPHGFLQAADAHHPTTTPSGEGTVVSFAIDGRHKMSGIIDAQHRVVRVQTWTAQSIVGDMLVETVYEGDKDFGGVLFPSRIVQKQDGFPSLDLTVTDVTVNVPVDIMPPNLARRADIHHRAIVREDGSRGGARRATRPTRTRAPIRFKHDELGT